MRESVLGSSDNLAVTGNSMFAEKNEKENMHTDLILQVIGYYSYLGKVLITVPNPWRAAVVVFFTDLIDILTYIIWSPEVIWAGDGHRNLGKYHV